MSILKRDFLINLIGLTEGVHPKPATVDYCSSLGTVLSPPLAEWQGSNLFYVISLQPIMLLGKD